jgi:hypothetical protein
VASYREYETLVARCGGWSVEDLGDLLHEIDRDRELHDEERSTLQARLYRLIWDRAQPRLKNGANGYRRHQAGKQAGSGERRDDEPHEA